MSIFIINCPIILSKIFFLKLKGLSDARTVSLIRNEMNMDLQ